MYIPSKHQFYHTPTFMSIQLICANVFAKTTLALVMFLIIVENRSDKYQIWHACVFRIFVGFASDTCFSKNSSKNSRHATANRTAEKSIICCFFRID